MYVDHNIYLLESCRVKQGEEMTLLSNVFSKLTVEAQDDPVQQAIELAKELISKGESKAEVARTIYPLIKDQPKDVIRQVLVNGVGLTEKGAITYHYNLIRLSKKSK